MRMEFSTRNFLRLVSSPLLRTYFEQRRLLLDFDWDGLGESVEPLYYACRGLPNEDRQIVWVDFENVYGLCSRRGLQTLLDAAGPDREAVGTSMGKGTVADKVFRVLLAHPDVFRVASHFAWADGLKRHWQPRQDIPPAEPVIGPDSLTALKNAVVARYKQLDDRGEYSDVEVHWRAEALYIMIYISDHPESVIHFDGSNQLKRSTQQRAFDVVYRYEPASGAFEMYAEGDKEFRRTLAQEFVSNILRQEVSLPIDEQLAFDLEKLKDSDFRFETDSDGVRSIELRMLRLAAGGANGGRITFGASPRTQRSQLHDFIKRGLNEADLPLSTLTVENVTIKAQVANGNRRPSSVTFNISAGNTCNLKDTAAHNKIRTCLKRSGVIRGQSAAATAQ